MTSLGLRAIWDGAIARGKADFLVLPDATLSYAGLVQAVRRWLARFDATGLVQGDRLVICTANEQALVTGIIAALLDGIVPVPLNADAPDVRLLALARTVEAKAIVCDRGTRPDGLAPDIAAIEFDGAVRAKGLFGRADALAGLPADPSARAPRLPDDRDGLAYLLFTSGTTASPSGVMITSGNLLANLMTLSRLFGYDEHSRIFNDMVIAHADGMVQGPLLALANRCAVIRSGGFQLGALEQWLDRVRRERATHVIAPPTVWAMIDAYAAHDDYFDAPECRALMSVAAKLPDDLWHRLEARFGRPVFNQYGLTETVTSALYAGPAPEMGGMGTIGRAVDCEARIDPAVADAAAGGELQLKGENIFPGYWRNPERTAASFTDDGWIKTGDLARLRSDGDFEILGRLKSVIKMGGLLIRPDEIDEAMLRHPAVRESVTIGFEDEMFGEVAVTGVVCIAPADPLELIAHLRSQLEPQKVPKRIVLLDRIPRGDAGKPQLSALRPLLAPADEAIAVRGLSNGAVSDEVRIVAADIFRVTPDRLTSHTGPGDLPGWDSFSQLNFVLAIEQRFAIAIPAARVAAIRTIGDMVRTVEELHA
jgi:long-chain acyl-CoA synthetase